MDVDDDLQNIELDFGKDEVSVVHYSDPYVQGVLVSK